MGGIAFEPFPRQVLLGGVSASMSYRSPVYDAVEWKSVTWWLDVLSGLPGTVTDPLRMFVEASDESDAPDADWLPLNPGGNAPNVGAPAMGTVTPTGRFLRVRVVITTGEVVAFLVRAVAREESDGV